MSGRTAALTTTVLLVAAAAAAQDASGLIQQAVALVRSGSYEAATRLLSQVPDNQPPAVLALRQIWLAESHRRLGRLDLVKAELEDASRFAAAAGADPRGRMKARVELTRGAYERDIGRRAASLATLKSALAIAEAAGDRRLLADAYGQLSDSYKEIESWEDVLFYAQKTFDLLDHPTPVERYRHTLAQGVGYYELFEPDLARAKDREALQIAREMGDERRVAQSTIELGLVADT